MIILGSLESTLLVQNCQFRSNGVVDPKFRVEGVAPTNHSSSQETKNLDRFFIRFVTIHAFDRRTDRDLSYR